MTKLFVSFLSNYYACFLSFYLLSSICPDAGSIGTLRERKFLFPEFSDATDNMHQKVSKETRNTPRDAGVSCIKFYRSNKRNIVFSFR